MKKYISLFIFAILFFSCTNVRESEYILSTGSSVIGVKTPILVHLADSLSLTEAELTTIATINPKTEIKCTINGGYTLAITAVGSFKYDTKYEITLDLNKISGGKQKDKFIFNVSTLNPEYSYSESQINIDNDDNLSISGDISSSDYVESDYIEKNFKILGQKLPIKWSHSQTGTLHSYTIDSVKRLTDSHILKFESNYQTKKAFEVYIPALNSYEILSCKVETSPSTQVVVTFSSTINPQQPFDELVTLCKDMKFNVIDNKLIIYPTERLIGEYELILSGIIESNSGKRLKEGEYSFRLTFPQIKPSIKFVSRGSILPSSNNMTLLFQSVNYAKARVRVKKIYSNNILQFFQTNNYTDGDNLVYVAATVKDTTFALAPQNSPKLLTENNYALNLSELIGADKGAIYRVEIKGEAPLTEEKELYDYEIEYYFGSYDTYNSRSRNILQSNLGIIAKGDDNENFTVFVTDLLSAKPIMGATVTMYNAVNQQLTNGETDNYGKVELKSKENPFIILAEYEGDKSYMKVENGLALSLSNFDVAGTNSMSGIKGYIFGERGVWRPGDDIFLTFIVTSKSAKLPENHPAKIEFRNPKGQLMSQLRLNKSLDGIYCFKLKTDTEAPTGNWEVVIDYGAEKFKKNIKIETIKPNRLKIGFKLNDTPLLPCDNIVANINTKWLHGAIAAGNKVKVNVELSHSKTKFQGYKDYSFDDDSKSYTTEEKELLSGVTDTNGDVTLRGQIEGVTGNTPGVLDAKFSVKAFEQSGDFSIDQYITKVSPYDTYVGIYVKEQSNDWGDTFLDIKSKHTFNFVTLDSSGRPKGVEKVKVELYKMEWNWWWDSSSENALAAYKEDSYNKPYDTRWVTMTGGKGSLTLNWENNNWGRYLIRVSDSNSGHSATKVCYVDDSYGRSNNGEERAATKLNITKDREKYSIGEQAILTIPSSKGAKALISLESGSKLLKSYWVDCEATKTNITIPIKEGMNPNIYAHITVLQPHNNTINDAPIRLYGVMKILVEDKNSRLTPIVTVADKVRPETEFTVTVSEKNGKPMSYVVAIVDEGLLDITRFKTPDAWRYFNAEEAIGVRTWDLFDNVIGAYGGRIEQLFAIGGDDALVGASKIKAERFKPVVHYIGAQRIGAGKKATHKIKLPPYFGSVRVMVVASNGVAQGSTDKRIEVKKPLLAQLTLPRVISTDEEIIVPVTLFTMENNVGNVDIELSCNELFTVVDKKSTTITINEAGEKMVYFRLRANKKIGIGKVEVKAKSSNDLSTSKIEINVRNANPSVTDSQAITIAGGASQNIEFKGTKINVECSTLPPLNISERLDYLTSYPHGCVEQIISGAFPQLYINDIMSCNIQMVKSMEYNVKSTLDRLNRYQLASGAFTYWAGTNNISNWGTIYAGHFMVEAEKRGYVVNSSMKTLWLNHLSKVNYENSNEQAYALYVLSLNGTPQRGQMNRLREKQGMDSEATWLLAGAYLLDNKIDVAKNIIRSITTKEQNNSSRDLTFGSREREMAIMLMVNNLLGEHEKSFTLASDMAKILNNKNIWLSTQSTAWMLNTLSKYITDSSNDGINMIINGVGVKSPKPITKTSIDAKTSTISLKNNSKSTTYVLLSRRYIPEKGSEVTKNNGLKITVNYVDFNGESISPTRLKAGTDIFVDVTVQNTNSYKDYTNIALTHLFPSGWEIGGSEVETSNISYRDTRDDRVLSYFDLRRGEQKRIRIKVTATYKGKFYLPSIYAELMYDGTINGSSKGQWIDVE